MKIDDIARQSLLWDFYGGLLSDRQRQVLELYNEENLSLQEIADEFGISRQAVHDALRSGQRSLDGYEEKLGLVARHLESREVIDAVDRRIGDLMEHPLSGDALSRELDDIRSIIDRLEQ